MLPREVASDVPFLEIFRSDFKQKKDQAIIAFILLYRFAEAIKLSEAGPAFSWFDNCATGGLGIFHHSGRLAYGHSVGMVRLVGGGIP